MKITIPEPCGQRWDEMTPKGMNRHCQMCQKEIIDFSYYSDAALVKYIESHQGRICGRFMSDQLNRELVYHAPKKSFLSFISQKWLAFWLFATAPVHFLKAQVKTEVSPELKTTTDTNQFFISGRVIDEEGYALPGVKIKLIELEKRTLSDFDGKFKFVFDNNSFTSYTIKAWNYLLNDTIYVKGIPVNNANVEIKVELSQKSEPLVGIIILKPESLSSEINEEEPISWRRKKRSKN